MSVTRQNWTVGPTDDAVASTAGPGVGGWPTLTSLRQRLAPAGGFRAQVLTLAGGTAVGQGLLLLAAPILTRLYGPRDFAVFALFAAGANILSAVGAGRYDFALMLPERDEEAANLLAVGMTLSALLALGGTAVLVLVHQPVVHALGFEGTGPWLWLVPVMLPIYVGYILMGRWRTRRQCFSCVAVAEIAAAATTVLSQVVAAVFLSRPTGMSLIWGYLAGRCVGFLILSSGFVADVAGGRVQITSGEMRRLARRYRSFPLVSAPSSVVGKAAHEVPKALVGAFFGPLVLGQVVLAKRVLQMPMAVLGNAVGQVFFPSISQVRHDVSKARRLILNTARMQLLLIAAPMIMLLLFAEPLFVFVFGNEWATAGQYARLLIPMLMAQFVIEPIQLTLQALERQRVVLAWQILLLALTAGALVLGHKLGSIQLALLGYSFVAMAMNVLYLWLCVRYAAAAGARAPSTGSFAPARGT
jgi:lipopolysaccharide exporter